VVRQKRLHIAQLLVTHVLGERFLAVIVLAALKVVGPLRHLLIQGRDLAAGSAFGVARLAVLFEVELALGFVSFDPGRNGANQRYTE
jgi:hypothetical protein